MPASLEVATLGAFTRPLPACPIDPPTAVETVGAVALVESTNEDHKEEERHTGHEAGCSEGH